MESQHIIVTEVPPGFLKRRTVRNHFSRFGTITRLSMQSSFCVITFETARQARHAITSGKFWNDMSMKISFTAEHDPFGTNEAVINEELNWFVEEPCLKTARSKSRGISNLELKSKDGPPKKMIKITEVGKDMRKVKDETNLPSNLSDSKNVGLKPENKAPVTGYKGVSIFPPSKSSLPLPGKSYVMQKSIDGDTKEESSSKQPAQSSKDSNQDKYLTRAGPLTIKSSIRPLEKGTLLVHSSKEAPQEIKPPSKLHMYVGSNKKNLKSSEVVESVDQLPIVAKVRSLSDTSKAKPMLEYVSKSNVPDRGKALGNPIEANNVKNQVTNVTTLFGERSQISSKPLGEYKSIDNVKAVGLSSDSNNARLFSTDESNESSKQLEGNRPLPLFSNISKLPPKYSEYSKVTSTLPEQSEGTSKSIDYIINPIHEQQDFNKVPSVFVGQNKYTTKGDNDGKESLSVATPAFSDLRQVSYSSVEKSEQSPKSLQKSNPLPHSTELIKPAPKNMDFGKTVSIFSTDESLKSSDRSKPPSGVTMTKHEEFSKSVPLFSGDSKEFSKSLDESKPLLQSTETVKPVSKDIDFGIVAPIFSEKTSESSKSPQKSKPLPHSTETIKPAPKDMHFEKEVSNFNEKCDESSKSSDRSKSPSDVITKHEEFAKAVFSGVSKVLSKSLDVNKPFLQTTEAIKPVSKVVDFGIVAPIISEKTSEIPKSFQENKPLTYSMETIKPAQEDMHFGKQVSNFSEKSDETSKSFPDIPITKDEKIKKIMPLFSGDSKGLSRSVDVTKQQLHQSTEIIEPATKGPDFGKIASIFSEVSHKSSKSPDRNQSSHFTEITITKHQEFGKVAPLVSGENKGILVCLDENKPLVQSTEAVRPITKGPNFGKAVSIFSEKSDESSKSLNQRSNTSHSSDVTITKQQELIKATPILSGESKNISMSSDGSKSLPQSTEAFKSVPNYPDSRKFSQTSKETSLSQERNKLIEVTKKSSDKQKGIPIFGDRSKGTSGTTERNKLIEVTKRSSDKQKGIPIFGERSKRISGANEKNKSSKHYSEEKIRNNEYKFNKEISIFRIESKETSEPQQERKSLLHHVTPFVADQSKRTASLEVRNTLPQSGKAIEILPVTSASPLLQLERKHISKPLEISEELSQSSEVSSKFNILQEGKANIIVGDGSSKPSGENKLLPTSTNAIKGYGDLKKVQTSFENESKLLKNFESSASVPSSQITPICVQENKTSLASKESSRLEGPKSWKSTVEQTAKIPKYNEVANFGSGNKSSSQEIAKSAEKIKPLPLISEEEILKYSNTSKIPSIFGEAVVSKEERKSLMQFPTEMLSKKRDEGKDIFDNKGRSVLLSSNQVTKNKDESKAIFKPKTAEDTHTTFKTSEFNKPLLKQSEEGYEVLRFEEISSNTKSSDDSKTSNKSNDFPFYNRVAYTLKDRLNILEERDRQIRTKLEKTAKMDSATQGTCPDLCPEKERILRELRGIVSPYEADADGRMDHTKAVKEYARSSADQEEPLPHELRSQPVLTMTMAYLNNCIISRIDNVDENLSNWYDFCWGRLRAIRKDIIQQQLCDRNTVEIIEQCARFHIACYDRLWGTSKSQFDDKINTETLVNCLQSLIHMYDDLRTEGIICPNEAEFNGYLILLNINSGFLTSEYHRYSKSLKASEVIRQAMQIHLAYNNNLFSKYFKLTKQASYLNACLMQRFFQHVRTEAINIIVKTHCAPKKFTSLPVDFIMDTLKIDSFEDCVSFCDSVGLNVNDGKHFLISRNDFYVSENTYTIESPSSLILNKRIPIANAVAGAGNSVPTYVEHSVHNSFTNEGVLRQGAYDASDQEEKMLRDTLTRGIMGRSKVSHVIRDSSPELQSELAEEKVSSSSDKMITDNISEEEPMDEDSFSENEDNALYTTATEFDQTDNNESSFHLEQEKEISNTNNCILSTPVATESSPGPGISPISVFQYIQQTPVHVKSSQKSITNESIFVTPEINDSSSISESINSGVNKYSEISSFASEFTIPPKSPDTPSTAMKECNENNKLSKQFQSSKILHKKKPFSKLEKSPTKESIYLNKLRKKLSENMKRISARKYLRVWKEKAAKLKSAKEFETWILHNMSVTDYIKLWGKPSVKHSLSLTNRLSTRKKSNIMVQIILHTDLIHKVDKNIRKIGKSVVDILGKVAVKKADNWGNIAQPNPVFWKLVFALPPRIDGGATFIMKLKNWCQAAFYDKSDAELSCVELQISQARIPIFSCVSIVEGSEDLGQCSNLTALIVVTAQEWETTAETEKRIIKLLSFKNHPIPVAVMNVSEHVDQIKINDMEGITHFQQCLWDNSKIMSEVLSDLARNVHLFNLKVKPFCLLISVCLEKLFDHLQQDRYFHDGLDAALNKPNNIVLFYNQMIEKIAQEIILCKEHNYFGTAYEFKTELEKYQNYFSFPDNYNDTNFVNSFSLRSHKCKIRPFRIHFRTTKEFVSYFRNYCDDIGCDGALRKLIRLIKPPDDDDKVKISDHLLSVHWPPIIEMLAKEILTSHLLTFNVVFREDVVNEILNSHFWLQSTIIQY